MSIFTFTGYVRVEKFSNQLLELGAASNMKTYFRADCFDLLLLFCHPLNSLLALHGWKSCRFFTSSCPQNVQVPYLIHNIVKIQK